MRSRDDSGGHYDLRFDNEVLALFLLRSNLVIHKYVIEDGLLPASLLALAQVLFNPSDLLKQCLFLSVIVLCCCLHEDTYILESEE